MGFNFGTTPHYLLKALYCFFKKLKINVWVKLQALSKLPLPLFYTISFLFYISLIFFIKDILNILILLIPLDPHPFGLEPFSTLLIIRFSWILPLFILTMLPFLLKLLFACFPLHRPLLLCLSPCALLLVTKQVSQTEIETSSSTILTPLLVAPLLPSFSLQIGRLHLKLLLFVETTNSIRNSGILLVAQY